MSEEAMMEITLLDKTEVPSADPARIGRKDIIVTYQTDPYHTYYVVIPEEIFSEEALRAAIAKDLEERQAWVGRKIEI